MAWDSLLRLGKPLVALASAGAVVSGLVGYYSAYRAVVEPRPPVSLPTLEKDPSIVVLPLANLTGDPAQEYFADGLSEELLNLLAKVPRLRVIARTSSFHFKGKDLPAEAIARKLNVAAVLEGSVRRSGDRVRVKLNLVRAADSSHVWSETYERSMGDIFLLQDEIAGAVVEQLKGAMLGAAPKSKPMDPRVYQRILQAEALYRQHTASGVAQALALLRDAESLAPHEPRVHVTTALARIAEAESGDRLLSEGYERARHHLQRALATNPGHAQAHALLGRIEMTHDGDFRGGARHMERALSLSPTDPTVLGQAGRLLLHLGRHDDALAALRYAAAQDPANPFRHGIIAAALAAAGRWDEAMAALRTSLSLGPGGSWGHGALALLLLRRGDPAAALAELQAEPNEAARSIGFAAVHHALGRKAESDAALAHLIAKYEKSSAYNIAGLLAYRNERDAAFDWLEKAVRYKDTGLSDLTYSWWFDNLHGDPRWPALLQRHGRTPEQLAAVGFKVSLPK